MIAVAFLVFFALQAGLLANQEFHLYPGFSNNAVEQFINPSMEHTLKAGLCKLYDTTWKVKVKVFHPKNPGADPLDGVVKVQVTNKYVPLGTAIQNADLICKTNFSDTYCEGQMKVADADVYVRVSSNNRPNIVYDVEVTFEEVNAVAPTVHPRFHKPERVFSSQPQIGSHELELEPSPLDPFYVASVNITLAYHEELRLKINLCPADTSKFIATSIFQAADKDSRSTIIQFLCRALPCNIDSNHIGNNTHALPFNLAQSTPDRYDVVYVYAVGFDGPNLDPTTHAPVGQFTYAFTKN